MLNSVRLIWTSGHSDMAANETADQLAKQAVHLDFVGPKPSIVTTSMTV